MLIAFIEGVIRLAIFLGYIAIISLTLILSAHLCITALSINASTA